MDDRHRKSEDHRYSRPGTNREAVPDGIEGSIMENEADRSPNRKPPKPDRTEGDERRIDDL